MTEAKHTGDLDRAIGARIRLRRLTLGLTQGGLASQVGVTWRQLRKYELGDNRISAARLQAIADALDISVASLFAERADVDPSSSAIAAPEVTRDGLELLRLWSGLPRPVRRSILALVRSASASDAAVRDVDELRAAVCPVAACDRASPA